MTESSTYQAILDEVHEKGRGAGIVQGEQLALLTIYQEWFGAVPPEVEARVRASTDPNRLQAAIRQVLRITVPSELQL